MSTSLTIHTSRLGRTMLALYRKLQALHDAADLPHHPVTHEQPEVHLGREPIESVGEYLAVITNPDETFAEWARVAGKDETFVIDVAVRSSLPAEYDQAAAWERITELTAAVEEVLYDETTGRLANFDVPNLRRTSHSAGVDQRLERHDSGWVGVGLVRLAFSARV